MKERCILINLFRIDLIFVQKKDYKDVLLFESIFKLVELFSINEMIHDKIKTNGLILLMIDIETTGYCNLTSYWNALSKLFSNNKQLIDSELMEILAANISKISFSSLKSYLNLVETCICKYNAQKTELCNFLPSLFLNVMSLSHVESIEPLNSCRLVITDLISKIEKKALTAQNFPCKLPSKDIFNLAEYEDLDESNHDPNERINMYLFNRLSSQFLIDDNTYEIHCSIFKKIVSKWPHLYPTIYCLFIYKIKSSTNCDVINYILDSMTDLISTKVDINLCLNTFRSLMSSSNGEGLIVKLVCMKQLTKLCTLKYDYLVYPHLSNELVSIRSLQLAENERLEVLYMKAYCINRIIRYRPDYYAQELLATISNLLNQCVHPNDEGICAILLDTISYLCESEVVDMMSTWTALLPQFNLEKRVLTLNAFCRFMSVAARLKHLESDNEVNFIEKDF
ncbi:focadhesin isoform X1 [Brachionus plicatilis]|uniref:Focadhesin isoform X1 n=1 Tax=Brachionus plicatilis TaxID=10195 RepID=A0A3M7P6T6_BRAPC|nr:focadhesin isoform X1 [Brachionus plicatilis]